jgi:hypothetical protein
MKAAKRITLTLATPRESRFGPSRRRRLAPAIALLSFLWAGPSLAATCDGVTVPDTVSAGGNLVLNGLGIRKATFLAVHVYVAGLYLPQKSSDPHQILAAHQPWQTVLHFVRDVDASDIRDAFEEAFSKVAGNKLATLQARITALNSRMTDLKKGQTLSFVSDPAKGVMLEVNGKGGAAFEGEDFSTALLATWIGAGSPNADLKSGMLGGACQ